MAAENVGSARPRTSGEILDDAWRLYFAESPALLLLSGLFLSPALAATLALLARPAREGPERLLLPAGAALLTALTGLGSGACQEYLRRGSDGRAAGVAASFAAALRRAPAHVAVRTGVLGASFLGAFGFIPWLTGVDTPAATLAAILGVGYLLVAGSLVWTASAAAHAALACDEHRPPLASTGGQAIRLDATKAAVVTLSRLPVLALGVFNLHLLIRIALWAGTNLGGFDVALASAQCTPGDPVYDLALVMLCWLLLAPYFEASNFLLYLDARARQEGLDLFQRVRRSFPAAARATVAPAVVAACLACAAPARADEAWPEAVHAARAEVEAVATEVASTNPYPGGARWLPRLRAAGARFNAATPDGPERGARWFDQALRGFTRRDRAGALRALGEISQRLELLEDSLAAPGSAVVAPRRPEDVKCLVRRRGDEGEESTPAERQPPPSREEKRRRPERDMPAPAELPAVPTGAAEIPSPMGTFGGMLLAGLLAAVVAVAAVQFWRTSPKAPHKPKTVIGESNGDPPEPRPDQQSAPVLWRQAEEFARGGRYREAVRSLYLAVLSHLHGRALLRYEPTRTNGEYVRQVRLAPGAPAELAEPFEDLTGRFEAVWYGGAVAAEADFHSCRELAEQARALAPG